MDYGLDSPLTIVVAVIYFTSVSASPQLAWLVLVDNQTVPWSIVTVIGYATDARQPRAYPVNVPTLLAIYADLASYIYATCDKEVIRMLF